MGCIAHTTIKPATGRQFE